MLPIKGGDPEINILYIGAYILRKIRRQKNKRMEIKKIFEIGENELFISVDYIIITLDWLYILSAIICNGSEVIINEAE